MTALREAAQRLLETCEERLPLMGQARIIDELNALRAALAEPVQGLAQADHVPDARETVFSRACPTPKTCRQHCCGGWCIPFLAGTVAARSET